MTKILFNKIKNISTNTITVNGTSISASSYLYICKNPKYFATYMSDITSLYTRGLVSIYDNTNSVISNENIWSNIDYNIHMASNPSINTTDTPVVISTSTALNGYESCIICTPTENIQLTLPTISTLDVCKELIIKNKSDYITTITCTSSDTLDNKTNYVTLNPLESVTIIPNSTLITWLKIISSGSDTKHNLLSNKQGGDGTFFGHNSAIEQGYLDNAGNPNGVALLDSNGYLPINKIPASLLGAVRYQGTWNATTNTPTLPTSPTVDIKGHYYVVNTSGTWNSVKYDVGDWIISNGTEWQRLDGSDAITSIFGRTGVVTAQSGDYHASQVNFTPYGNISSSDVQNAVCELEVKKLSKLDASATYSHISHNHAASQITTVATGGVSATNVQGAIAELASGKQATATAEGKYTQLINSYNYVGSCGALSSSTAQGWTKLCSWPCATYAKRGAYFNWTSGARGDAIGDLHVSWMIEGNASALSSARVVYTEITNPFNTYDFKLFINGANVELWFNDANTNNTQQSFSLVKVYNTAPTLYYGVSGSLPSYTSGVNGERKTTLPVSHATTSTDFGVGNASNYGHVKLDDMPILNSSNGVTSGAVYAANLGKRDRIDKGGIKTYNQLSTRRWKGIAQINYVSIYSGCTTHIVFTDRFCHYDVYIRAEGGSSTVGMDRFDLMYEGTITPNIKVIISGYMLYLYAYDVNQYTQTSILSIEMGSGSNIAASTLDYDSTTDPGTGIAPYSICRYNKLHYCNNLTSDAQTQFDIIKGQDTESLRANINITGGGTLSVSYAYNIRWSGRFIIIDNGRGYNFSTGGHFDIVMPSVGTVITGVGGHAGATVTSDGIPLGEWNALYYILPIGSSFDSVPGNFRLVTYTSNIDIPAHWVLIALRNADGSAPVYFTTYGGITLNADQSRNTRISMDTSLNDKVSKTVAADQNMVSSLISAGNIQASSFFSSNGFMGIWTPDPSFARFCNKNAPSTSYGFMQDANGNSFVSGVTAYLRPGDTQANQVAVSSSGIILNGPTSVNGDITIPQASTTGTRQIRFTGGDNDFGRIAVGATASNAGWMEIATADDANEPIYVRQYSGNYATVARTATLLDASGNTSFPGSVSHATPATDDDSTKSATTAWVKDVAAPINHEHTTDDITDLSTTLSNVANKFSYKYSTIDGVNLWTQIAAFTVGAGTTYNFGIEFVMAGDDFPWSTSPVNMYVSIRDTAIDVCGICTSNKSPHIEVYYGISNGVAKVYLKNYSHWVTSYSGVILYDSHNVVNFASSSTTAPTSAYTNIYTFTTTPRIITAALGSITTYIDGVIYLEY